MAAKLAYIWDYDVDENDLRGILAGRVKMGRLDRDWATLRLLEYAPYSDIIKLLGYGGVVESWPRLRGQIRSQSRKRGFDFLVDWLKTRHPEML